MDSNLFARFSLHAAMFCLVFALTLTSNSASAQKEEQSGAQIRKSSVRGKVHDSDGRPVGDTTVYLEATKGSATETWKTRTDAAGNFHFDGLSAGSYAVRPEGGETSVSMVKAVELAANQTKNIDFVLDVASAGDSSLSSAKLPQLFDKPEFTVAGVASAETAGGHGSDTVLRNSEALVRDTVSLGTDETAEKKEAVKNPAEDGILLQEGAEIQAEILREENTGASSTVGAENPDDKARNDTNLDNSASHQRAKLYHRLAQIDEKLGNPLEAVHEYQRAAELEPTETNVFDWASELLTHRALEPATLVFTKGNTLYPKSARMLIGLGVSWYVRGSYERAAEALAKASDLAPDNPSPYLFMGKMVSGMPQPSPEMVERLARFAKLAPQNAMAPYYYALALDKQAPGTVDDARFSELEGLLQKATQIDPKLGAAWLQLGILYAQRGDDGRALASYRKAVEVDSGMEEAHYRLALAYKKTGDDAAAEKELKRHEQLAKQAAEQVEQERGEIQGFVISLREAGSGKK